MPNKDIKTEPRFMTMIQKDLLPTCKALNLDVDPLPLREPCSSTVTA